LGLDISGQNGVIRFGLAALVIALAGCTGVLTTPPDNASNRFFAQISAHCGKAYAGRLVSSEAPDTDMMGVPMTMHVRSCSESEIRIPFHVGKGDGGWDRSRTWIISRTSNGLRLKHDHRHEDGIEDKLTMYGGDTKSEGTASRQEFLVDEESIALFRREGLERSVTNVWAVEISPTKDPKRVFAYELRRTGENARFFRVEFDLTKPIEAPPSPWGHP
jgi:hypothetical protein